MQDEVLYSYLARTSRLNVVGSPRAASRVFFGGRAVIPSVDLPANLTLLADGLAYADVLPSTSDLIEAHTLFPYYAAFLGNQRKRGIKARLEGPGVGIKTALGIVANGLGASGHLRWCAQCLEEDRHIYGAGLWRRHHLLPEVVVCAKHHCLLIEVGKQSSFGQRRLLLLPDDVATGSGRSARRALNLLDRFSVDLLRPGFPTLDRSLTRIAVIDRLRKIGFVRGSNQIRWSSLQELVLSRHRGFQNLSVGSRLMSSGQMKWLPPVLNRMERSLHPLCHLILISSIFETWEDFFGVYGGEPSRALEEARQSRRPVIGLDDPLLSCRRVAQMNAISVQSVVTMRKRQGLRVAVRPKKITSTTVRSVCNDVARGDSVKRVAEAHRISLSTAYRIVAVDPDAKANKMRLQIPGARRKWQAALLSRSVSEARDIASGAYAWLYRNDKKWLLRRNSTHSIARS